MTEPTDTQPRMSNHDALRVFFVVLTIGIFFAFMNTHGETAAIYFAAGVVGVSTLYLESCLRERDRLARAQDSGEPPSAT